MSVFMLAPCPTWLDGSLTWRTTTFADRSLRWGSPASVLAEMKQEERRYGESIAVRLTRSDPDYGNVEERTVTENIGLDGALILTTMAVFEGEMFEVEEIGGGFRAKAQVVRATIGDDQVGRLDMRFVGERAAAQARELLRRRGVLHSEPVMVDSEIPSDHPDRQAVEDAVQHAFNGAPGDWTVRIELQSDFQPPWWMIAVEGFGESFRLSFPPPEQNPHVIGDRVRETLRRRGLVK